MAETYNDAMMEHLFEVNDKIQNQVKSVFILQDYGGSFSSEGKASELVKAKTNLNHPTPCDICDNYLGNANPDGSVYGAGESHSH